MILIYQQTPPHNYLAAEVVFFSTSLIHQLSKWQLENRILSPKSLNFSRRKLRLLHFFLFYFSSFILYKNISENTNIDFLNFGMFHQRKKIKIKIYTAIAVLRFKLNSADGILLQYMTRIKFDWHLNAQDYKVLVVRTLKNKTTDM